MKKIYNEIGDQMGTDMIFFLINETLNNLKIAKLETNHQMLNRN